MPFFIAIALSLLAGAAVPMQAGSNARLGAVLGHPFWATVISLMVSGAAIALVMLLVKVPRIVAETLMPDLYVVKRRHVQRRRQSDQ